MAFELSKFVYKHVNKDERMDVTEIILVLRIDQDVIYFGEASVCREPNELFSLVPPLCFSSLYSYSHRAEGKSFSLCSFPILNLQGD